MKALLANPYVSRALGAVVVAAGDYVISHDLKRSLVVGFGFLVYGATHATATKAGDQ